jgi:hypothetical protein
VEVEVVQAGGENLHWHGARKAPGVLEILHPWRGSVIAKDGCAQRPNLRNVAPEPRITDTFGPEGVAVDALTAAPPPPAAYAEDLILEATAVRDSLGWGTS